MKVTDEQAKKVADRIEDYSPKDIKETAEMFPDMQFALSSGIGKRWIRFRCITCFGPIRKIFYCLIAVKMPEEVNKTEQLGFGILRGVIGDQ